MATKIRDVMTAPPVWLPPAETVSTAARMMRDQGIGCVLVHDAGRLLGMLTDRDIAVRVLAENRDPRLTTVAEACSSELVVLSPDEDAAAAVKLMRERSIRRVPVVEGDTPVGMVTIGDLALHNDADSALADVSAAPPNV